MNNIMDTILNGIQEDYKKNYKRTLEIDKTYCESLGDAFKNKAEAEWKKFIQENPEQYNPEKHKHLFTDEEVKNLCQK